MTDEEQARSALAEVARRRNETVRLAGREAGPTWYFVALGVIALVLALVSDLRSQLPSWNGWFTRWAVPAIGFVLIVTFAVLAYRRASVTLHRTARGPHTTAAAVGGVALIVLVLAIGMPMRYYRIPFDQTGSLVGAALIVGIAWLVWRGVRSRRG